MRPRTLLLLASTALSACAAPQLQQRTLTRDGAWCWFADPRGVRVAGDHDRTYAGWVTSRGDIVVASYDHDTGKLVEQVVHPALERDDHANPALLAGADRRITVFYSRHAGDAILTRTTLRPEDVSAWGPERALTPNSGAFGRDNYCYPNPYRLSDEVDRVFLFWRGDHWKPTLATSVDGGRTFGPGRIVVMRPGAGAGNRPYLKVASNGRDTLHLAFTDGHPRSEPHNSIYYARYRRGRFERADGTPIAPLAALPFAPRQADLVYDAAATGARAWIWDVAADPQGHPVLVYVRLPSETEHRYHYARFDGSRWHDHEVTLAGRWFPQTAAGAREREPHYSGGIVLDHGDVDVVYLSRKVGGVFEVERWQTGDLGATWRRQPVTRGSRFDNVRPFVVRGHGDAGPTVLWMRLDGEYRHYTRYHTSLQMAGPRLPPVRPADTGTDGTR